MQQIPYPCSKFDNAVLINADCAAALACMESDSVELVIIDPPYGGQTHNQNTWDIAWNKQFWNTIIAHIFRVLTKGGHLVVFASGKTVFDMHSKIGSAYTKSFHTEVSFYHMIWYHKSLDSGRVHSHTPRSQFEDIMVYFRTGEGKIMQSAGTLPQSYFDQHVGRTNVLEFYKDDCARKPYKTIQNYFAENPRMSTFDYKPEGLLRAIIRDFTSPDHTVVDLCMRHGITGVATTLESRKFIGIELEEKSYKLARGRYADQFGNAPSDANKIVRVCVPTIATSKFQFWDNGDVWVDILDANAVSMLQNMSAHSPTAQYTIGQYAYEATLLTNPSGDYANQKNLSTNAARRVRQTPTTLSQEDMDTDSTVTDTSPNTRKTLCVDMETLPSKRTKQAQSDLAGKRVYIGTTKRHLELLVLEKFTSIENNHYKVAYEDKPGDLKIMQLLRKYIYKIGDDISEDILRIMRAGKVSHRF